MDGVTFSGFYEANAERAATVAQELGVNAYPTLDALLADVDALSIVTPTKAHHAVAKAALEAGKHLLIEKPITATIEEADELIALAKRQGRDGADRPHRAVQPRHPRGAARTWIIRCSSTATGSRRSIRGDRTSRWCSIS